jgi:peptide/nickel transport system substrate-binding protein
MNSGYIVSKKAVEKMGREKFSKDPIGTGPYQLDSWKPKTHVKLVAFDGYWGKSQKSKTLLFFLLSKTVLVRQRLEQARLISADRR